MKDLFPSIDMCRSGEFKRRHQNPESILVGSDREGLLFMVSSIEASLRSICYSLGTLKETIEVAEDLYRMLDNPLKKQTEEQN